MIHEQTYTLYLHTTPNNKYYVGQTCQLPERRWQNGYGYATQQLFYRAIKKYGWENIEHEIIAHNLTKQEVDNFEILMIHKLHSNSPKYGYNNSIGGEANHKGCKHSEETKKKISESGKGRKHTDEQNQAKSKIQKGKITSEETKKRISKSLKGKIVSDETKKKLSESHKGYIFSDEHKQKISNSRKGKYVGVKSHNYGTHLPEETKKKISESLKLKQNGEDKYNAKPVICLETEKVYKTIHQANIDNNITEGCISKVCRGKSQYAGKHSITNQKLHWMYYSEYCKLNKTLYDDRLSC